MRLWLAKIAALANSVMILLLSLLFAWLQNR
jgi:hypothetical protein